MQRVRMTASIKIANTTPLKGNEKTAVRTKGRGSKTADSRNLRAARVSFSRREIKAAYTKANTKSTPNRKSNVFIISVWLSIVLVSETFHFHFTANFHYLHIFQFTTTTALRMSLYYPSFSFLSRKMFLSSLI